MARLLSAVLFLALLGVGTLQAQDSTTPPPLQIEAADAGTPRVRIGDILADPSLEEALRSGLPLRIEVVTRLWKDGFFDSQKGESRWRASVVYDPLERRYVLTLPDSAGWEKDYPALQDLRDAFPRTLRPSLHPSEEGRYYYAGRIEVETLSLSDLQELRRWLRGDLAEAIRGQGGVEGAVERGLRRTMVRLLGMPERRFDARSRTFQYTPPGDGSG